MRSTASRQKLVRRHPHVFGDADKLSQPEEVLGRWEELKAAERAGAGATKPKTLLSGVPAHAAGAAPRVRVQQPRGDGGVRLGQRPGTCSTRWTRRFGRYGRRWNARSRSRWREGSTASGGVEEEVGDLLFAIANLSRKLGVEPEAALRRANDKFRERFTAVEHRVEARGERLQDKTLEELEAEWQAVKTREA